MDTLSPARRSWNMSRIRGGNTGPERVVRSLLHRMGYRFRIHQRGLPGSPDIVLPRLGIAIFVHGCFWHRHSGCKYAYSPKSRQAFWSRKFVQNQERDRRAQRRLRRMGWRVWVVWECQTSRPEVLGERLRRRLSPARLKP